MRRFFPTAQCKIRLLPLRKPPQQSKCRGRADSFFHRHKEIILILVASILFPFAQAVLGFISNTFSENQKVKYNILHEFSQSYSTFLSYADDYYYNICEENYKTDSRAEGKKPHEFRVELLKKMLDIRQPDATLHIILYSYNSDKVKDKTRKLILLTRKTTECLQCTVPGDEFNSIIDAANSAYIDLIRAMSEESLF